MAAKTAQIAPLPEFDKANRFELRRGGTRITYDAITFAGPRQLHFKVTGQPPRIFSGDEVRLESSELGTLATVTLEAIPDGPTHLLTLMLPVVLLDGSEEKVSVPVVFHTIKGSIAGPPLEPGPVQTYDVKIFKGPASFVIA